MNVDDMMSEMAGLRAAAMKAYGIAHDRLFVNLTITHNRLYVWVSPPDDPPIFGYGDTVPLAVASALNQLQNVQRKRYTQAEIEATLGCRI
jgi:hypothetical protein